ncbi:tryptophan transporter [Clostridium sp.]|uniref:tryptophan transporter n=1 Tax=Clostridium sp. TaxID=1506 RepID=UPI003F2F3E8D
MNRNLKTRKMIMNSILIALGALLHQITPALGLPMQPDFALAILFVIILVNDDYKTTLLSSIVIGVLTALTTKFPGGQLPNIIDKVITANIMYLMILPLRNRVSNNFKMLSMLIVGTVISGLIFLTSAQVIVGLPSAFMSLVKVVVIPTTIMNAFLGMILYKSVSTAFKITGIQVNV